MVTKKKIVIPILLISSLMCSCSKKNMNTEELNKAVLEISNYSSNKESNVDADTSNINDAVINNIDKLLELKSNSDISDVILTNDGEFNDMIYQISQAIISKYCNDHYFDVYNPEEEEEKETLSEEAIQRENERIEESKKYNVIINDLVERINELENYDKDNDIESYIDEVEDINNVFNTLPEYYKPNVLNKKKLFEALEEIENLKETTSSESESSDENYESVEDNDELIENEDESNEESSESIEDEQELLESEVETSEEIVADSEETVESSESIEETELETVEINVDELETAGDVEYLKDGLDESESSDNESESAEDESDSTNAESETSESKSEYDANDDDYYNLLNTIPDNFLDDVIDNGPFDVEIDLIKLYEDIVSLNEYLRVDGKNLVLDRKALDNDNHTIVIRIGSRIEISVVESVYKINKYDSIRDYIYWDDSTFKVRCIDSNNNDVILLGYYDKQGNVNILSGLEDLVKENRVDIYVELLNPTN